MKKKIIKSVLGIIIVFAIIYVGLSIYLSIKAYAIVKSSYKNYGKFDKKWEDIVIPEDYSIINFRYEPTPVMDKEICNLSPFLTIHSFTKATVYYKYKYEQYINGHISHGSWDIPCRIDFELINGHWVVTGYHEAP